MLNLGSWVLDPGGTADRRAGPGPAAGETAGGAVPTACPRPSACGSAPRPAAGTPHALDVSLEHSAKRARDLLPANALPLCLLLSPSRRRGAPAPPVLSPTPPHLPLHSVLSSHIEATVQSRRLYLRGVSITQARSPASCWRVPPRSSWDIICLPCCRRRFLSSALTVALHAHQWLPMTTDMGQSPPSWFQALHHALNSPFWTRSRLPRALATPDRGSCYPHPCLCSF